MRLQLTAAALLVATVAADNTALYERLLGKSQFENKNAIEKFILNLAELNKLQNQINGQPEIASDSSGQSYLDAVGSEEPVKPDLLPYLFEGDIILTEAQMNRTIQEKRIQALFKKIGRTPPTKRSLTSDTRVRWSFPVAYWIDTSTGVSTSAIQAGVAKWTELTCATFRQYNYQPSGLPSLRFIRGDGCYSYIGQSSTYGTQEVSIGTGCTSLGTVTHEIGHALGFYHEQSRPERDNYVTIQTQNIPGTYQSQFTKQSASSAINYGVEYDYGSVMHYDGYGFSANGGRTITTRDANYQATIGQRDEPSFADVKQINTAYCSSQCAGSTLDCKSGGYPDPKNCNVCRCPPGLGGTLCDEVQTSLSSTCGDTDLTATLNLQQVTVAGDTDCYYRITAPAGRKVFVSFTTISFPAYTPCAVSFAEIKYKSNAVVTGARVCGSNRPSSATSEGQTMLILYKGASTSRFTFSYRFDPATPVDTTTAPVTVPTTTTTTTAGPTTSTTTRRSTTTTTTTQRPTTTTTTQATTTWPSWFTTTTASTACQWSECTADCGGCGTQTRRCNGYIETQYCATNPCPGNACCRPFTFIFNGVCSRGEIPGTGGGRGGWDADHSELPHEPITNHIPEDEPTTVASAPTTPYITPEEDKHTIHIQPPDLPLKIELPEEQFRPDEKVITIDANKIVGLRASRVAARPVQTAEEVSVVDGSGDAPATGEEGLEIALNKDLEGSGVEGSGTDDDIVTPVTPAICPEVPYPRIVPESGILDTVAVPVIDRNSMPLASSAEEKSIVTRYKEKDGKKDGKDKKKDSSSSSSEEDLAAGSGLKRRVRRYVFPSAIPRIRFGDRDRSVNAAAVAPRHG